ncbi:MAG: hypothetical protein ACREQJ_03100, partial [Candidatus Binatia bacterium]
MEPRCLKVRDRAPSIRALLFALILSFALPLPAASQAQAPNCLGDVSAAKSCTANDMNFANAKAGVIFDPQGDPNCPADCADTDPDTECVIDRANFPNCDFGCRDENDTVTFELLVDVRNSGQNQRYDVGVFAALDGGDAFHGECEVAVISPGGEFTNLEPGADADQCGDIQVSETITVKVGTVTDLDCTDADPLGNEDGFLTVNGCVSWDNNTKTFCTDEEDAEAGTPAKCD